MFGPIFPGLGNDIRCKVCDLSGCPIYRAVFRVVETLDTSYVRKLAYHSIRESTPIYTFGRKVYFKLSWVDSGTFTNSPL